MQFNWLYMGAQRAYNPSEAREPPAGTRFKAGHRPAAEASNNNNKLGLSCAKLRSSCAKRTGYKEVELIFDLQNIIEVAFHLLRFEVVFHL